MLAEIFGVDGVIVIIVVVAVLFGGSQIPKLARSLGSAHTEFKKGLSEGAEGAKDGSKDSAKTDDATTS
jgi:sec-independent protein translocase protein TatA